MPIDCGVSPIDDRFSNPVACDIIGNWQGFRKERAGLTTMISKEIEIGQGWVYASGSIHLLPIWTILTLANGEV